MTNTIQLNANNESQIIAEANICKTCGQPILLGEPVKVTWNDELEEHIVCPAPKIGQVSGEIQ